MDENLIIVTSVLSAAWGVLLVVCVVLCVQVASLRRKVAEMTATGRIRVQKLKMEPDKNHAFHNASIAPNEELSRRGYSMYMGPPPEDLESGRGTERQTGGQFVDELTRELDNRQQRQSTAPPFLLQSIEENKRKSRSLNNPVAQRKSDTNHNFMY